MFSKSTQLIALIWLWVSVEASEIDITVSKVPKILDIVDKLNYPEGTNSSITCSVGSGDLSSLTYEWRKDDIVINGKGKKVRIWTATENDQSILRIANLDKDDSGVYSCLAKNKFGLDRVSTKLNVKVQLKWIHEPQNVEVQVGKALDVLCLADSSPKPTMEWFKLDEKDNSASGVFMGPELRFDSIRLQDSGSYECRAKNGVERDLTSRIEVKVLGK